MKKRESYESNCVIILEILIIRNVKTGTAAGTLLLLAMETRCIQGPPLTEVGTHGIAVKSKQSNPTKWTHFGVMSATVGVILLHNIKSISN